MSVLEARAVTKRFPGTLALDNVSCSFESGKVHALVGKNGSGKSTLLKIISGSLEKTSGEVLLDGEKLELTSTKDGFDRGIATVYQELSLIPSLSVTENILIGRLPTRAGIIDWKEARRYVAQLLDDLGIEIGCDEPVAALSMWQRQMIEIAKAMSFEPRVLQLDEPTSSLASFEVEALFKIIRRLRDKDVVIVYISHKLQELWQIADTCTVIRDGKYIGRVEMKDTSREQLVDMMFGEVRAEKRPAGLKRSDKVALEVKNLTRRGKFRDVSFKLYEGEVLGIAGMLGSGRTELLKAVFGAAPFDSGEILFAGERIARANLAKMKKLGMALTPEDRKHEGLILQNSVADNLTYASLEALSKFGFMQKRAEREVVDRQIADLQIKVSSPAVKVESLSGGNQQKVVVGNWLATEPSVMIFDEPSRGIDVAAKQQIFRIMWDKSAEGISSIMVSTELDELIETCSRILVIRHGEIKEELDPDEISVNELYAKCMAEN